MRKLQFFISSPGDVCEERALASRVIERLQSEYMGRVALETVLWEHEPLVATSTFQVQLVKPSETDVVVSILWSRLDTRLPAQFTRADGSRYESGTEYEFEEAMEGFRRNGKPDLPQKKKLDEFIEKWFHDRAEGTIAVPKLPHLALRVRLFLKAVGHTKYKEIPGKNFNGDHLMRGSNLEFMYAEKILPFAQ